MKVTRPLLRYHGGKFILAPWIIAHMPEHRVYVEPYGGAASVLFRKPRCYAEVYNDLDSEVVNLFRVVRDNGAELKRLLTLTPFSREEYQSAWQPAENQMEQARRTVIRSFMGFASAAVTLARKPKDTTRGITANTGFRSNSNQSGTPPAQDWQHFTGTGFKAYTGEGRYTTHAKNFVDQASALDALIERLRGVVIENKEALEVMKTHDGAKTLHYVDPPYVKTTRDKGSDYRHEMTDADHETLAEFLQTLQGMVIVSGYHSPLYDRLFDGWQRVERAALADGARKRTEVLWLRNCPKQQAELLPK